jgi:hypothetical protein
MSCCDENTARLPNDALSRRAMFKGAALVASVIPAAGSLSGEARAQAAGKQVKLARTTAAAQ